MNKDISEYVYSTDSKYNRGKRRSINNAKIKISGNLGELIEIAVDGHREKTIHHSKNNPGAKNYGIIRYKTNFAIPVKDSNGNISYNTYTADLLVEIHKNNLRSPDNKHKIGIIPNFYDLVNIKRSGHSVTLAYTSGLGGQASFTNSKTQSPNIVNSNPANNPTNNGQHSRNLDLSDEYRPDGTRKDLQAVHNLNQRKLSGVLDLGGLPAPSIAVTKDSIGHDEFGDISLLFDRDTIDPAKNEWNRVYSRDAWTQMFPTVEVVPAHAGVIPTSQRILLIRYRSPRTCGGDPVHLCLLIQVKT